MKLVRSTIKMVRALLDVRFSRTHTNLPAQIVSYDPVKNTCSIQLCIKVFRSDDTETGESELPQLDDIPVVLAGSGDVFLTCPVKADSYGVYHVSEDDINQWLDQGGVVSPTSVDRFNLDTGFFEPAAPWCFDSSFGAIKTDRIGIRTRDGSTEISVLENGNVEVIADGEIIFNSGTDYAVQYTALKTGFDALKADFNGLVALYNAHIHITTATVALAPVGVISPTVSTGSSSSASVDSSKIDTIRVP